ncbi:MAG: cyclic pyranopterin monophosphate synthase MoaC [Bacteroidetes bacterium]|nr:cyclic pyranopterin monophosphate synthase MoaC [Bacteroidota bacterium]
MEQLSHTNADGKANMVDVSGKKEQLRIAAATGHITLNPETIRLIRENEIKKGDVLTVSEIAGIQGAKRTSELIPLCHPLKITKIDVKAELDPTGVLVTGETRCVGQTGVEMEALTAVSVTLLAIWDMVKAVDKDLRIDEIRLVSKTKQDLI